MKSKKNIIIFMVFLLALIAIISMFFTKYRNNLIEIKAETINDSQEMGLKIENQKIEDDKIQEKEHILENSGYLNLGEDINADDASIILPQTMYQWNFYREDHNKVVYLTFDDGPSQYVTEKILDILKINDVKATFFTLGSTINKNSKAPSIIKRMAREGHAIGNHGYSHRYEILYPKGSVDVKAFMNDMKQNEDLLKSILGKDFHTRVLRMPGGHGSWNGIAALDQELLKNDMYQTDWNSLNGDAEGHGFSKEHLLGKLKETVGDKDVAIVLMHDTDAKENTVEYLQSAIDYLKLQGYKFRTLK